jgi:hypothetical protein
MRSPILLSSVQEWTGTGVCVGNWGSEFRIENCIGDVVAFPGPIVNANAGVLPGFDFGGEILQKRVGVFGRIGSPIMHVRR